jgi:hypothetical protein
MTEAYFVKHPYGPDKSSDSATSLIPNDYYQLPVSADLKKIVEISLSDGAKVVTCEVGCILQLAHDHATEAEIGFLVQLAHGRIQRLYWSQVRKFIIENIDSRYHGLIPV